MGIRKRLTAGIIFLGGLALFLGGCSGSDVPASSNVAPDESVSASAMVVTQNFVWDNVTVLGTGNSPCIALRSNGDGYVAWHMGYLYPVPGTYAAWHSGATTRWDPAVYGSTNFYPALGINKFGNTVFATWNEYGLQGQFVALGGRPAVGNESILYNGVLNLYQVQKTAIGDDNGALVVWSGVNPTGTFNRIYAKAGKMAGGDSWDNTTAIDNNDAGANVNPIYVRLAMDKAGTKAVAVWQQQRVSGSGEYAIIANTASKQGGKWSWNNATRIDNTAGGDAGMPDVAIDAMGNILAIWIQKDAGNLGTNSLYACRKPYDGAKWGPPVFIDISRTSWVGNYPRIAFDNTSNAANAMAVWEKVDNKILFNYFNGGSKNWDGARVIFDNGTTSTKPELAFGSTNNVMVIWQAGGNNIAASNGTYTKPLGWSFPSTSLLASTGSSAYLNDGGTHLKGYQDGTKAVNYIAVWETAASTIESRHFR